MPHLTDDPLLFRIPWLGPFLKRHVQEIVADMNEEIAPDKAGAEGIPHFEWIEDLDPAKLRKAYTEMMADAQVKAALLTKLFEVCSLDISVVPTDAEDERAIEVAEFIKHNLTHLKGGSTKGLLMKIARPALQHQFSISEIVLQSEKKGRFKGKWTLKVLKSKNITTGLWGFEVDDFKNVSNYIHTVKGHRFHYPVEKFIHYAYLPEFENPRGMSDLRAAYRGWFVKRFVLRALAVISDKLGHIPVASDVSNANRASVEKQLKAFAGRRWLALPPDVQLEIVDFAHRTAIDGYGKTVAIMDKQIVNSIMGAALQSLEGDKTGARSMGEVHQSTTKLWVWYLAAELADIINEQLVPQLVRLNFADADIPLVRLEAAEQEDLKLQSDIDKNLHEIGLPLSKQEFYERYNRTPPKDEDDELKKAAMPAMVPGQNPNDPNAPPDPDDPDDPEDPEDLSRGDDRWAASWLEIFDRTGRAG